MQIKYSVTELKKRLFAIFMAITFFLFALLIRILVLTTVNGEAIVSKAYKQWLRDLPMTASRGSILDRNGVSLASSYTTYDIYVRPVEVENAEQTAKVIADASGELFEKVLEKVSKKGVSEVKVLSAQEKSVVNKILFNFTEGIFFTENTSRNYAYGDLLSQIIGFVSSDGSGQSGLEKEYNKYLQGVNGVSLVESDLRGTTLSDSLCYYLPSIDGLNIQLTIDVQIQQEVERIVEQARLQNGAKSASAIVMDPSNGEILAIATKPSYDLNNVPRDDIDTLLKLSKATTITDVYEPGSTFKIVTTAIAMNEGLTSKHDYFYCSGFRIVNGVKINCHRRSGHGSQSLGQGLKNSCNCVFMELIRRIGLEKFYEYMQAFGIVSGYNLDFPGEGKGVLMPKAVVTDGDLFRMGFGQSIALTPLQLVTAVSTAINGGTLFQPHFVTKIAQDDGTVLYNKEPLAVRSVLKNTVSTDLLPLLRDVVASGGGKYAKVEGYDIGGKTGTAQKYENGVIAQGKYVASFIGFYPTDVPQYTVLVVIDEPQGAFYGGVVAAPVAKSIFESIFKIKEEKENENLASQDRLEKADIVLPNLIGKSLTESVKILTELGLQYLTMGEGKYVKDTIASPGAMVSSGDIVLLVF